MQVESNWGDITRALKHRISPANCSNKLSVQKPIQANKNYQNSTILVICIVNPPVTIWQMALNETQDIKEKI